MKKTILFLSVLMGFGLNGYANVSLSAQCNDESGKMAQCTVSSAGNVLQITYQMKKNAHLNRAIASADITRLTAGEFSKQRTAEAVLISPLFLLSKRKFESYSVEYNQAGKKDFVTISIKQKYGHTLRSLLESVSNRQAEKVSSDNSGVVK